MEEVMTTSKKKTLIMVAAVAIFLLAAQVTGSEAGSGAFKLEGAWIARVVEGDLPPDSPQVQWSYVLAPSPSGNSASLHGSVDVAFAPPGGEYDFITPLIGEVVKTGPRTAVSNAYYYLIKDNEIVLIGRALGEMVFLEPGVAKVTILFEDYLPTQDGDGDGLPDPGQDPFATSTYTTRDRRIPSPVE